MPGHSRLILVGLGNPILGDDGIGWRVVEEAERTISSSNQTRTLHLTYKCLALGGLSLMEELIDYDYAIVVDSLETNLAKPGTVFQCDLSELPDYSSGHTTAVHDTSLMNAIKMGRLMNLQLPSEIKVVGIEAKQVYDFSEEFTPEVIAAVPECVEIIINLINQLEEKQ